MSRFDSGNRLVAAARNRSPLRGVGGGRQVGLNAPGVVPVQSQSDGARLADEALAALRGFGGLANQIGAQASRRAAQVKEERVEFEAVHRGEAAVNAQTELAELLDQIEARELTLDGETAQEAAERMVADRVKGQVGAYADQYRKIALPRIVAAFVQQERGIQDEAKRDIDTGFHAVVENAADPRDLQRVVFDAQSVLGLSETEAVGRYGIAALNHAAATGDRDKFQWVSEFIGDRFPAERLKAQNTLDAVADRAERERRNEAEQGFYTRLYDEAPVESLREYIDKHRGALGDEAAVRLRGFIDRHEQERLDTERKVAAAQQVERFEASVYEAATQAALNSQASLAFLAIEDAVLPADQSLDGREHAIPASEIRERAITAAMEQVERLSASPEEALSRQVGLLARTGQTFGFWERVLHAGYTSGAAAFVDEEGPIPPTPALTAGFDLYKRLEAVSQPIALQHAKSDAGMFYKIASLTERYTGAESPEALARAMRAVRSGAMPNTMAESLPKDAFDDAVKWTREAVNGSQVRGDIEMLARIFMAEPGLDAKTALKEASSMVRSMHTKVNGAYIYTGDRSMPPNADKLATLSARLYAEKHGETEGVRPGDLALVPGPVPDTFVLANMRVPGRPFVENWQTEGLFTLADFARLEETRVAVKRQDIARAQNDRQQRPGVFQRAFEAVNDAGRFKN